MRDKAIVMRILGGSVKNAVQLQKAGLFVEFVFVLAAFADFDIGDEIVRSNAFWVNVFPWVHSFYLTSHYTHLRANGVLSALQ
jgi:hypothetical protein